METWTKTCGPIPGGFTLTHTQMPGRFFVFLAEKPTIGCEKRGGQAHRPKQHTLQLSKHDVEVLVEHHAPHVKEASKGPTLDSQKGLAKPTRSSPMKPLRWVLGP